MEETCNNLMNVVVANRLKNTKVCADLNGQSHVMETNILHEHLKSISKYKQGNRLENLPSTLEKDAKDIDEFKERILKNQRRKENVSKNLKNAQEIVLQMKNNRYLDNTKDYLPSALIANAKNEKREKPVQHDTASHE